MIHHLEDRLGAPDRNFIGHRDLVTRSLARYHFVAPYLRGVTLDIGCGRGYGLEVIQSSTSAGIGLDVSLRFLRDARRQLFSVPLACGTGDALPFASNSFDSVTSFDVIEHIQDDIGFLSEIRRVAREDGFVAISTPNRVAASGAGIKPLYRAHVREYSSGELRALLSQIFSKASLFGQHEQLQSHSPARKLMNLAIRLVPVRWRFLLPADVQGLVRTLLLPPLRLAECRFEVTGLDNAHTFVALCQP